MEKKEEGVFDFKMESIDMLLFQDKDFREEQKKVKEILKEQAVRRADLLQQQKCRRQRQKATSAYEINDGDDFDDIEKKKKSAQVEKEKPVYDFQFDHFVDWSKRDFNRFLSSFLIH